MRRPFAGYAMVLVAATLFGVNEDAHYLARQMGLPEPTIDWKLPIPD